MFTNTAFSPQPLPSCHLVFHSGICLNPLSQLKPIPMFTNITFSPHPLPSCHLVLHSGICLNPLSQLKPIPPCLQTQFFLPNHFPPVILSSTVVDVLIISAQVWKRFFLTTDLHAVILSCTVVNVQIPSAQLLSQPQAYYHLSLHSGIGSNPLR